MDLFLAGEPRRFVQIWPSLETGEWIVREGLLGRAGRLTETGLRPEAVPVEERGRGYVDGWDRGKRAGDGKLVCHVFARSMDGELGAVAAMAALKWRRSDPQRATIAHRSHDGEEWTVRYERVNGKLPGPFVL
ncbi:hypothetical protein [Galactobacter valiniphilus]|uniref:hypothetical protein n=1 Tax=Galactobacter valiniphilus TaxID=2676122 RepID=UPI00373651D4